MTVILCQSREFTDKIDGPPVLDLTGNDDPPGEMEQVPGTAELLETVFQKAAPSGGLWVERWGEMQPPFFPIRHRVPPTHRTLV